MLEIGPQPPHVVVLISAGAEWRAVRKRFSAEAVQPSPYHEWFQTQLTGDTSPVVFLHGGWGKIAAAGSTQYAIDRWEPDVLFNFGTCGGFAGEVEVGTILLVERTIVYDIVDAMVNPAADTAIARYTTTLDLAWLKDPLPLPVRRSLMLSADRDLVAGEISALKANYGAIAGDWESGAIAYVAALNRVPCLILRGVSDLVGPEGGEAYGHYDLFIQRAEEIMNSLLDALPAWIAKAQTLSLR